jgi:2-polyprenyl-3-methyl-5-hydroxy-6-metoxy-1,4-benzoquinol methylase
MEFQDSDFTPIDACPWCGARSAEYMYTSRHASRVARCVACGVWYSARQLNAAGLRKFWSDYLNEEHRADDDALRKRKAMYAIDYAYAAQFLPEKAAVLDVGCADGLFLDFFHKAGHSCCGVEYGHAAALEAARKYRVWEGVFPDLQIDALFDMLLFRGVLQYFQEPQKYLRKAVELLKPCGYIYITAQPNMDSFCHNLYKEKYNQALSATDFVGYTKKTLASFFSGHGLRLAGEAYFYEETPYADVPRDIARVSAALEEKARSGVVTGSSPPFWGNMMTLMFQKNV